MQAPRIHLRARSLAGSRIPARVTEREIVAVGLPSRRVDSLTHIAVGSAIGMAAMGARTPRWRAALWGSVCATLPDLDVLIPHADPIRVMTFHRAESHSVFYLTLVAPLIALLISRIYGEQALFRRWWLTVWLALIFHPLLDVMTAYGTQIALPFTNHPYGIGNLFIIDPLFSLPVIVGSLVALTWRDPRAVRWNAGGLALSATYVVWTLLAQQHVTQIARESLAASGIDAERVEIGPTPFNSILWRITAMTPQSYAEGFYSLFDDEQRVHFREHPRGAELYEQFSGNWYVDRMAWFTKGVFMMELRDELVRITDLRLGVEPYYTFSFAVFERRGEDFVSIRPVQLGKRPDVGRALPWLWRRMRGEPLPPLSDVVTLTDPQFGSK